jgi:hypothetical protein
VSTVEHTLTAYWGAARDRIPASATDQFAENDEPEKTHVAPGTTSQREIQNYHVVGTNPDNLVHIRSGQFWANCPEDETKAYEETLEPTLRAGLAYLWDNPQKSGAMGLRYLYNRPPTARAALEKTRETKESCVAGFFRNLADLEHWAKSHPSHLAIYTGAIKHAKKFGDQRKFRTWHEVSVLKHGEAHFEYVNCMGRTGVMQGMPHLQAWIG